jgi:hypothetical protein
MALIDYQTNLKTDNDPARQRIYMKLQKHFGYLPVYGPTLVDVNRAGQLFEWIVNEYPGYKWVVEFRDSICTVVNEDLAPNWGFRIRESKLDNDGRAIRLMAGELLEKFNLARKGKDEEAMAELPRDAQGNVARQI